MAAPSTGSTRSDRRQINKEEGHEVTSKRVHVVGGDGTGADPGCRHHRSGEAVVAVPGRGPRSALRYGGQEDQESIHSAPARGEEVEHLRLVPAHEGRLLDRGRLRRRRRVETARGQDAAGRGGGVPQTVPGGKPTPGTWFPGGRGLGGRCPSFGGAPH